MAAGLTGSLFPPGKWYSDLNKPRWTPPNWIFPVAWPILYILMSYSGATLANLENSGSALALWALQIAINTLWTPVFFGAYDLLGALVLILALWIAILCYTVVSFKIDKIAAYLFIPYLAWVSFATILNFEYLRIN